MYIEIFPSVATCSFPLCALFHQVGSGSLIIEFYAWATTLALHTGLHTLVTQAFRNEVYDLVILIISASVAGLQLLMYIEHSTQIHGKILPPIHKKCRPLSAKFVLT